MTVVTLPVATVPEPWLTEQVCVGPVGCVLTVTAKVPPLCIGVENENEPFALTVRSLPPLFCRTRPVPPRPLTVPPTVYELVAQLTTTPVTSLVPMVPDALESWQVWAGPVGWVLIDTVKVAPLATVVGKVKAPPAVIGRSSPPLSCRVRPVPARPLTVPPTW